jgi:SAM-dependent methyltransferase
MMIPDELDELIPPPELNFVGDGDFRAIGEDFLRLFITYGGLQPDEAVLDVGCGVGRMALPLIRYLGSQGRYEGMDIVASGINWCREKITIRYPNFRFRLADVYNRHYNPHGRYQASQYRFAYRDETFDFVFLTSVFTHMLPGDVESYIAEIARVLKPSGRCLITFFLINQESLQYIDAGASRFSFQHMFEHYRIEHDDLPEAAVAYDEQFVVQLCETHGLHLQRPPVYGAWCGRSGTDCWQDIVVLSKQ